MPGDGKDFIRKIIIPAVPMFHTFFFVVESNQDTPIIS